MNAAFIQCIMIVTEVNNVNLAFSNAMDNRETYSFHFQ